MGEKVTINEVGLRDGLQIQPKFVSTEGKLELCQALVDAGVSMFEAVSFVSPKAVPQMANAAEVYRALPETGRITYSALVLNEKGYDRAIEAGAKIVSMALASTDTMNRKNLNMSVAESMGVAERLLRRAKDDALAARVDVSVAFVCAYEGAVHPDKVAAQTDALFELGADQVCLCDTTGRADPRHVARLFAMVRRKHGSERLSGHFHDTYGMALANTVAAMQQGIAFFDTAIGGLGGCPYSPGASGNVATEDVVSMLRQMGVASTIDLDRLCDVTDFVKDFSGAIPSSAYYRATRVERKPALRR